MINLSVIFACLVSVALTARAATSADIKVLLIDGFSNHDWQRNTEMIKSILAKSGKFDVTVSTVPATNTATVWRPDFSSHDVVIQTCNNISSKTQWPEQVQHDLESFVQNGGGLFIYHSANNSFPEWPEYDKMIGVGWRNKNHGFALTIDENSNTIRIPPGEGGNTSHGARIDAVITRLGDHPIHAGLPQKWMAADIEVYRYVRGSAENLTVISYAMEPKTGLNFPIEWVVSYGKGRVYNSTFGHVWKDQDAPEGVRCTGFQTILVRALEWLAGKDIDGLVPSDFPTDKAKALR